MLKMTKRYLIVILSLILILATTAIITPNNLYATTPSVGSVTTVFSPLNLRSGPGIKYRVITKMPRHTILKIYSSHGNWYKVQYGKVIGYAHKNYIAPYLSTKAARVVSDTISFLGVRYVWGGTSPSGFDCSGLIQYVYKRQGVSLPRVAQAQSRVGVSVSKSNMRVGDLMFFSARGSINSVDHVGIYIGYGKFIHSSSAGRGVIVTSVNRPYYVRTLVRIKRVF